MEAGNPSIDCAQRRSGTDVSRRCVPVCDPAGRCAAGVAANSAISLLAKP